MTYTDTPNIVATVTLPSIAACQRECLDANLCILGIWKGNTEECILVENYNAQSLQRSQNTIVFHRHCCEFTV